MSSTELSARRRRLSVITLDQAIAGSSNVLISLLAALILGVESFGLYGIVFLVYVVAQGICRALVCDPLLLLGESARDHAREAMGASVQLGVALGALVVASGVAVWPAEGRLGKGLVVLGVFLPLLVVQDLGRYAAFATHRPTAALVLDVVWLVLLLAGAVALVAADGRQLAWFVGIWGSSGAVAGGLAFWQNRGPLRFGLAWFRRVWRYGSRYLVSYGSVNVGALAAYSGIGAIAGARALGGINGASLLMRPFMTFQLAAVASTITDVARTSAVTAVRRQAINVTGLAVIVAAVNALIVLVLPDSLGGKVLGDSWEAAEPLLLATSVQIVCIAASTGARAGVLGRRAVGKAMGVDIATSALVLVLALIGAQWNGALGAVWAVTVGHAVMALVWWTVLWRLDPVEQPSAEAEVVAGS